MLICSSVGKNVYKIHFYQSWQTILPNIFSLHLFSNISNFKFSYIITHEESLTAPCVLAIFNNISFLFKKAINRESKSCYSHLLLFCIERCKCCVIFVISPYPSLNSLIYLNLQYIFFA